LQEQVFSSSRCATTTTHTHRLWQKVRKREREEKSAAGFAKCIG